MIEAATTQERYATAIQSSHLRVEGEYIRGPMDYVIAAGWCKSKFGAALMRLQAEWDGAERRVPVKPTKRAILAAAQVKFETKNYKDTKGRDREKQVRKVTTESRLAAEKRLNEYYENELAKLKRALKSLPEVKRALQLKLLLDGVDAEIAEALLLYWLDPNCKVCHGTGFQPRRPTSICGKCQERPGKATIPGGEVGKGVLHFLDDLHKAAGGEARSYCKS